MGSLWAKFIEWISHRPSVESISEDIFTRGLWSGFIAGAAAVAVVLIIIWLLSRKNGDNMIKVESKTGTITVSVSAIGSVIRHAGESAIPCLDIQRVRIFKKSGGYQVVIRARMDASRDTAPQLMDKLAVIVKEQMSAAFGISNISDVKLIIASCRGNADIPENEAAQDDKSASAKSEYSTFIPLKTSRRDEDL